MGVEYIGLSAVGWHVMTENWWDIVVAVLSLVGVVSALLYLLIILVRHLWRQHQARKGLVPAVPPKIEQHMTQFSTEVYKLGAEIKSTQDPKTFGVYLGSFTNPLSKPQVDLLSKWDILVLDPAQEGAMNAARASTSSQILGRLDVSSIASHSKALKETGWIQVLDQLVGALRARFGASDARQTAFTGVLLANWQAFLPPVICRELIKLLKLHELDVYVEASEPNFLTAHEIRHIGMDLIKGLICRNGTILRNGDRRDYYQMAEMRRAQRGLAKHMSLGGIVFAMWETIDDDAELSHSVVNRSFLWCRFNTALAWIGPEAALTDADVAAKETQEGVPLGALMWMKTNETMTVHDTWRLNDSISHTSCNDTGVYDGLDGFVPQLAQKLRLLPPGENTDPATQTQIDASFDLRSVHRDPDLDPLSFSADGESYTGLGCFQTGLSASPEAFTALVNGQRQLRDLTPCMLDRLEYSALRDIEEQLRPLRDLSPQLEDTNGLPLAIHQLLDLLATATGEGDDRLRVYMGIHSGFHRGTGEQYWGLYDADPVDRGDYAGFFDLFISLKASDRASTILHTWLSMKHFSRTTCFKVELLLASHTNRLDSIWQLTPRQIQDIEGLSSRDLLQLLQRLSLSTNESSIDLARRMQRLCRLQLIEIPTRDQLRKQNTEGYLRGEISAEALVNNRLALYRDQGCPAPFAPNAVDVFKTVEARVSQMLMRREANLLADIEAVLQRVVRKGHIDAAADIFAMSVFCAFRKLAVEEVYLEILDRNPLPNRHADQAACFAEMFATGSQCETYFDMTSNVLGRILRDKYQAFYMKNQPPTRQDGTTELPTSYASKSIDEDPDAHRPELPAYYQVTFLSIFAVPALIDILFLTILGRGLYLSNYMSEDEKTMATAGLMAGLLLCGGIGTWIGYGGSYYLHAMSFPAMNMFVITRFTAGIAMLTFISFWAFILIGALRSWYSGFIFVFYFASLNTYLTILATLAIYQFPGFMFQSGRTTVVACLPILLISPILTLWVHKDIVVYPCVISAFLIALTLGTREVVAKWGTWYLKVPVISDTEVVNFYTKVTPKEEVPNISDLAATPLPRKAFFAALKKELNRKPWQKSQADDLIKKHAAGYDATVFLMDWYCKYSRTAMPYPYSPTWNLMVKTAIDTLKDMQKGLKLHNAFIHWRFGGDQVWCGVLYFIIALMDKWVSLLSGGRVVGLSDAGSPIFRLAVGFALAYYLIAAVCLDAVAQPLWPKANKMTDQPISSLESLQDVANNDAKARRKLYWGNFAKFFFSHLWGLAVTSALMWTFESSRPATIMYLSYIGAYTGLLLYQYNRIFCGARAMNALIFSAIVGLIVGLCIRSYQPEFAFGSVIALGTATWIAAVLSWRTADVGRPARQPAHTTKPKTSPAFFSSSVGSSSTFSPRTLSEIFLMLQSLPEEERQRVDPSTNPGIGAMHLLHYATTRLRPELVSKAFPDAERTLDATSTLWSQGDVIVDLVSSQHLSDGQERLRSLSRLHKGKLHLIVFLSRYLEIQQQSRVVAECVLRATAEAKLSLSYADAALAELLVAENDPAHDIVVPEGIKHHIDSSSSRCRQVNQDGEAEVLRSLLFDLDCDIEWDSLPPHIRSALIGRCTTSDCLLDQRQMKWLCSRRSGQAATDVEQRVSRCNLSIRLALAVKKYALARSRDSFLTSEGASELSPQYKRFNDPPIPLRRPQSFFGKVYYRIRSIYKGWRFAIKFFVIATTADPEYQRELDFFIQDKPWLLRCLACVVLNGIWIYCHRLQSAIVPLFMFHHRRDVAKLRANMRGTKTTMKKDRVTTESYQGVTTAFLRTKANGVIRFHLYSGRHETQPQSLDKLLSVSTYAGKRLQLIRREEYVDKEIANVYTYFYENDAKGRPGGLPEYRECISGEKMEENVTYDDNGHMISGTYWRDDNLIHFRYYYRQHAHYDDELIRANFSLSNLNIQVSWCYPPPHHSGDLDSWIPNAKVTKAKYTIGSDYYESVWNYDHRSHPSIETTLDGESVPTPAMIKYDWFGILKKPKNCSFLGDDPLLAFKNRRSNWLVRLLELNTKWYPISTSAARNLMWRTWKGTKDLDAVTIRWLDEHAMRKDSAMKGYWLRRDLGLLRTARAHFHRQADAILARTDIDPEISSWSTIAIKYGDLDSFGQGGDARINTRSVSTQIQDTHEKLHVLAMDTGTWPNEGGGVSACRRDMVNDLSTIRWHVVAENANDFGVPKFQTERNIQSLTVLPLWGMDFLTPNHGVFQDILDSAVQRRSNHTYEQDIKRNFLPILESLVKCARAIRFGPEHIEEASRALVDLSNYFDKDRHWTETWMSDCVKQRWRELWLAGDVENATPISQWWDAELPTLAHLDNALDMWHRFLFIFTLPVPERIPDVFQASHHFAGASYGVLCKLKRNCTFHVWDHCISWREVTVFLSSAMSFDAPFVCTSLVHLSRMTSVLILHYADVVLPCADFFNPGWEVEHGTQEGLLQHRKTFARKIDPVVNGICNMENFVPIKKIKSKIPTVVMLSHVRFVKDIKNAILAADIIVNEWGFKDYQLDIYGDMEKAPAYSVECKEILAAKGLRDHVALKGLGSPSKVLEDAWIFLNSSVSEGLPLAMGEAALTGVPVVCTDVGASFRVVTDPVTWKKFSAVVAPNDSYSLAKAQINVMGLLDEWSEYAEDEPGSTPPKLSLHPSRDEVEKITQRMYAKEEQRRKLGMMGRTNVLNSFSSHRYLREHEQMLWVGKTQSPSYLARRSLNTGERGKEAEGSQSGRS